VENQYIFGNSKRINRHVEENQSNSFNHSLLIDNVIFFGFWRNITSTNEFYGRHPIHSCTTRSQYSNRWSTCWFDAFYLDVFYCSSICPMGIYQDTVRGYQKNSYEKNVTPIAKAKTILRWSILGAVIVSFVFGFTFLLGLLDPYGAYGRIVTHLFRPAYLAGNNLLAEIFRNSRTIHLQISIYGLGIFQPSSPC